MKSWEWFLGSLGGFVIIPYLWFRGKDLEEKTEKAINYAGYIGLAIICLFILAIVLTATKKRRG